MPIRPLHAMLATLPAVALVLWFTLTYHYVAPVGEQWGLVPIFDRLLEGELTFKDVWVQKNVHRIFFPKLILFGLVRFTAWDHTYEALTNCVLGVVALAGVLFVLLPPARFSRRFPGPAVVLLVSAFSLSISQFENWIWGMQITLLLCFAATVWGLALLSRPLHGARVMAAIGLGWIATFSLSLGLAFWPAGLLAVWLAPASNKRQRVRMAIGWSLASAVTIWTFFYRFREGKRAGEGLGDVLHTVGYVLTYLGNPVSTDPTWAIVLGLAALGLGGYLVVWHWRSGTPRGDVHIAVTFMAHTMLTGVLIGAGRAHFSLEQALSSRYITFANLLWIGLLGLLIRFWSARPVRSGRAERAAGGVGILLIVAMVAGGTIGALQGYRKAVLVSERVQWAKAAVLATYPDVPPRVIAALNFNHPEETLKVYLPLLERHGLSLFERQTAPKASTRQKRKERRRRRSKEQR